MFSFVCSRSPNSQMPRGLGASWGLLLPCYHCYLAHATFYFWTPLVPPTELVVTLPPREAKQAGLWLRLPGHSLRSQPGGSRGALPQANMRNWGRGALCCLISEGERQGYGSCSEKSLPAPGLHSPPKAPAALSTLLQLKPPPPIPPGKGPTTAPGAPSPTCPMGLSTCQPTCSPFLHPDHSLTQAHSLAAKGMRQIQLAGQARSGKGPVWPLKLSPARCSRPPRTTLTTTSRESPCSKYSSTMGCTFFSNSASSSSGTTVA